MLNYNDDIRNLTPEQIRLKSEALTAELKAIEKRTNDHPESLTNDVMRRIADISDWLRVGGEPEKRLCGPEPIQGSGGDYGYGNEEDQKNLRFGQFLQATAAAVVPAGQRFGQFETGRVYRNILEPEARSTGLEESTPSLGGFLVAKEMATDIFQKVHETGKIFNRAWQIPIGPGKNGLKMPYIDETSRATGSRLGGIQVYRLEEGGTKTASKPKFGLLELSLSKQIGLVYTSDELLEDAAALGAIVRRGFGEEFAFMQDDECLNGNGSGGQFLGILNSNCLVTVAKESGQNKGIVWENIKKMFGQWYGNIDNGVWLVNRSCWTELMNMSIPTGTGGIPVWMPANLAKGRPNSTLMGMPVIAVEQCQTLGTKGDIYLCDWTQYLGITKGGIQEAISIHLKFETDETAFRFVLRNDAQPLWNNSLTPYKDAASTLPLSPFVALAVRT